MRLIYRPIVSWPGERTTDRRTAPFEAGWSETLELLDRELRMLNVDEAVLQVDSPSERDFRLDGKMSADAKLRSPAIILSFDAPGIGPLTYPCDTFAKRGYRARLEGWQANVRAVALGLEALRKIERYGIAGMRQQYTGWKQLGAGIAMPAAAPMTADAAARFLADEAAMYSECGAEWPIKPWDRDGKGYAVLLHDRAEVDRAFRLAARRHHPDAGGDAEIFKKLTEARDLLLLSAR